MRIWRNHKGVVSELPRKCNLKVGTDKEKEVYQKMSDVYEIKQPSELLITINALQSEIKLSEEDAQVILG